MKVSHPQDGEIVRYWLRKNKMAVVRTACCDCGLTHLEMLIPRKKYIRVQAWRDEKWTKRMRGKRRVVGSK